MKKICLLTRSRAGSIAVYADGSRILLNRHKAETFDLDGFVKIARAVYLRKDEYKGSNLKKVGVNKYLATFFFGDGCTETAAFQKKYEYKNVVSELTGIHCNSEEREREEWINNMIRKGQVLERIRVVSSCDRSFA